MLPFGLGSKAHLSCGRPQTSEVMAVKLDSFTEAGGRGLQGVAPPITAPFHSKVSIFTAPYLDNYWVRNEKTSDLDMGRRPELKSEVFFMRTQ